VLKSHIFVDFRLPHSQRDLRQVVCRLARYSTLLERLLAMCQKDEKTAHRGTDVRDLAYRECCQQVQSYYDAAIENYSLDLQQSPAMARSSEAFNESLPQPNSWTHGPSPYALEDSTITEVNDQGSTQWTHERSNTIQSMDDDLQDMLKVVKNKERITPQHIGILARCLILVWTYHVGAILWQDSDKEDAKAELPDFPRVFEHVPLQDLPDVAAWA
jgi:hypothetical protein